jgi:hypothetical protein
MFRYSCVLCALLRDTLMSGFMFTRDNKPGCGCTGCADDWAEHQFGYPDTQPQNQGNKMAISYNCLVGLVVAHSHHIHPVCMTTCRWLFYKVLHRASLTCAKHCRCV